MTSHVGERRVGDSRSYQRGSLTGSKSHQHQTAYSTIHPPGPLASQVVVDVQHDIIVPGQEKCVGGLGGDGHEEGEAPRKPIDRDGGVGGPMSPFESDILLEAGQCRRHATNLGDVREAIDIGRQVPVLCQHLLAPREP